MTANSFLSTASHSGVSPSSRRVSGRALSQVFSPTPLPGASLLMRGNGRMDKNTCIFCVVKTHLNSVS